VSTLDRKLVRDLRRLGGQVLTIALVVAAGIAGYVTLRSTWASLEEAKSAYYEQYRFGDVFAHVTRAPSSVADELEDIPGVSVVYPRVVHQVMMPMAGMAEPATGTLVSLPPDGIAPLDDLYLRSGRMPEPGRDDEAVIVESFAKAHQLQPGDHAAPPADRRHRAVPGVRVRGQRERLRRR
jgi:putative ABC transport system permease protein